MSGPRGRDVWVVCRCFSLGSYPMIDVHDEGPVRVVALDRPDRRNAVDGPTAEALSAAFRDFDVDPAVSVAVLTGRGGTFCAGADLKALAAGEGANAFEPAPADGPMGPSRMVLAKPVIAAIEGHAVAGGLELALWCDLRVVAEDAVLGVFCRRWGVPLIDLGCVRLPRIVGQGRALDLILTGRAVGAAEALAIGLADRVVPPGGTLTAAVELAQEIARFPQDCVRADRALVLAQWELAPEEILAREHTAGMAVLAAESITGAQRFADGAGRHGTPA